MGLVGFSAAVGSTAATVAAGVGMRLRGAPLMWTLLGPDEAVRFRGTCTVKYIVEPLQL